MGNESKKTTKLNGMPICDELMDKIKELLLRRDGNTRFLDAFGGDLSLITAPSKSGESRVVFFVKIPRIALFGSARHDVLLLDFVKEKFPEYLI